MFVWFEKYFVVLFLENGISGYNGLRPGSLKKNQNASIPSEHPSVREENVKTFRWDHRLQIQNLFMTFKWVARW